MSDTLIRNVRIFDGERLVKANAVVLRGGLITEVGVDLSPPSGVKTVDGRGGTLLPGLIDCHVHARLGNLEQALAFGVTTELDMYNRPEVAGGLRAAAAGRADVADCRSSLQGAVPPGGWLFKDAPVVAGPAEAVAFVQARIREGADYIKVFVDPGGRPIGLSPETLRALVDAAHAGGKRVLAHAESATAARRFIEAGGDGLAHVLQDLAPDAALLARLRRNGDFVVPTLRLSALASGAGDAARRQLFDHPRLGPFLDPRVRRLVAEDPPRLPRLDFAGALRTTRLLHGAGIPILAGTDAAAGIPARESPVWWVAGHGIALHHELELLVQAGLGPVDALAAATALPARCFGLNDRGRIASGRRADLLLVDGDPTKEIKATREIVGVWRSGGRLDRKAHRATFAETDVDRSFRSLGRNSHAKGGDV